MSGSKDGSQNMFLWRNMANYPKIIFVTPFILSTVRAQNKCSSYRIYLAIKWEFSSLYRMTSDYLNKPHELQLKDSIFTS